MAAVARQLDKPMSVKDELDAVLHAASEAIPHVDAASITVMYRDGRLKTVAGAEPLVYMLDQMQYELGEGPCLDALKHQPVLRVDNMVTDRRWPRYAPLAADKGIRSQMGCELYRDEHSTAGLNLYSRTAHAFDSDTQHLAELFATHAAIAMGRTRQVEELNQALATRKLIGQATGIVMHRFEIDEDTAFEFLVRVSRNSNTKLRDVAHEIVDNLNTRAHAKGSATATTGSSVRAAR